MERSTRFPASAPAECPSTTSRLARFWIAFTSIAPLKRRKGTLMYEFPEKKTSGRQAPLPDNLRAGLETLSNRSMEGVTVNYDSPVPAQVGALAVTQGKNIFLGPGQEQHLAHEGWHAAQQMDGRVQGTTTVAGLAVN